jgi:hypothetical protein
VTSRGTEKYPPPGYTDLDQPPKSDEFATIRMIRLLQRHFNDRYQAYGRHVHVIVQIGATEQVTPEARRADALAGIAKVKPFAALAYAGANVDAYVTTLRSKGVVTFVGTPMYAGRGRVGFSTEFYKAANGLAWSYDPAQEQRADVFTTYVCKKVLGHPVSFSGNPIDTGQPRRLGLITSSDRYFPDVIEYDALVVKKLQACGARFELEVKSSTQNRAANQLYCQEGVDNMAALQQKRVTTIIYLAGYDVCQSNGAAAVGYHPEIVVAGFGVESVNLGGRLHDQSVWSHARTVTSFLRHGRLEEEPCYRAATEVDAQAGRFDVQNFACTFFPDMRLVFTGIQVAGPRLSVASMDQGFHAIPAISSKDPRVPACFYGVGDYSCVKDAMVAWWDPSGVAPGRNEPGCWRMFEAGKRYRAGEWPAGDVEALRKPTDPCNGGGVELT